MQWSVDFQARFGGDVGGSSAIRKFVEQKKAHRHRVQCSLQGFLLTFRQLHIYIFLRAWLDEMPLRHPVNRAFQYISLLG